MSARYSHHELASEELTLDPHDWEEVRALGHRMVDDMLAHLRTVRERPVWSSVPRSTREALDEPVPWSGTSLTSVYDQFLDLILPYPTGNTHPRFFGWVMGTGTVTGMLADMLASGLNAHVAGYDQSAAEVERTVIGWLCEMFGFPKSASGLLVSGGTMANLNGLAVARHMRAAFDVRTQGLQAKDVPRLTVFGSDQTHGWIYKACELMGLGNAAFKAVPTSRDFKIDIRTAREMIQADMTAGLRPFCLVGNVGTVSTGAVDDLPEMRALADEFGLWLHLDGAFGSLAALAPNAKDRVAGQELADSLAFDLHKWGYMPFEVACILVRDASQQTATFGQAASYLSSIGRGLSVGTTYFADKGVQLSRGFRALKVWMSLKEQGVELIGRIIQQNIDQAAYFAQLVQEHDELELVAPTSLNVVCFQFRPADTRDIDLSELNKDLLTRLHESGIAVPSHTSIDGAFALRVCITNHRTRRADLELLANEVVRIGCRILDERRGQAYC